MAYKVFPDLALLTSPDLFLAIPTVSLLPSPAALLQSYVLDTPNPTVPHALSLRPAITQEAFSSYYSPIWLANTY